MIRVIFRAVAFKPCLPVAVSMKAYRVSGIAPFGSMRQKFSLEFAAENKEAAEHQAYSILGSRHKAKRRTIKIESVKEIDPTKVRTKIVTKIFKAKGRENAVEGRRRRQTPDPNLTNRVAKLPPTTRT